MSLTKNPRTHTFLLVKLCEQQGKEQHGKAIRHFGGAVVWGPQSYW